MLSCILLAAQAEGCEVTTIEGLGDEGALSALQRAFIEEDALPVRLLHAGPGGLGDGAAGREPAAVERAGARRDERQPLPLRRVPGHRARGAARRRGARGLMAKLQ